MNKNEMPKFGVARKYAKDLSEYIVSLNQNNIDAYEMGFAYGIATDFPNETIELAKKHNIGLSCHLPFWINLGNSTEKKNIDYLVSGLKIAEKLGSVAVFHLGFYGKKKFGDLKMDIVKSIHEALELSEVKNGKLGIETTGKQEAIGTVDEIIELIRLIGDNKVVPVVDWAHLYARSNGVHPYTYQDFRGILEKVEREIGYRPFYFHCGGIEYKCGNELRHVSAKTFEPPAPHLFAALKDFDYKNFTYIVESPDSIEDVKWLKQVWDSPNEYFKEVPSRKTKTLFDFGIDR